MSCSSLNVPNTWWRMFHKRVFRMNVLEDQCLTRQMPQSQSATRSDVVFSGQCNGANVTSDPQMQKRTMHKFSALFIGYFVNSLFYKFRVQFLPHQFYLLTKSSNVFHVSMIYLLSRPGQKALFILTVEISLSVLNHGL